MAGEDPVDPWSLPAGMPGPARPRRVAVIVDPAGLGVDDQVAAGVRKAAVLPRMAGVFGRWDWVANTVLFGLYHVHKIWYLPSMITTSFGLAWATRRYRSLWMGVIVHGVEGFFIVLVLAVILGWYP